MHWFTLLLTSFLLTFSPLRASLIQQDEGGSSGNKRFEVRLMTDKHDLKRLAFFKVKKVSFESSALTTVQEILEERSFITHDYRQVCITDIGDFWGTAIPDRSPNASAPCFRLRHMLFGGFWVEKGKKDFLSTVVEIWGCAPCKDEDFDPHKSSLSFPELIFRYALVAPRESKKIALLEQTIRGALNFVKESLRESIQVDIKALEEKNHCNVLSTEYPSNKIEILIHETLSKTK